MSWHDREENALKRWFDNFKIDRNASFAGHYECLIVQEVQATARRIHKRQVCHIENEGAGTSREVLMDHTAPPAPMLTFAAKARWIPPPPKTEAELRKEAEWNRMISMGYEPVRRPKYLMSPLRLYPGDMSPSSDFDIDYEIEWVPRRRPSVDDYLRMAMQMSQTPLPSFSEPKHRRNV